MPSPSAESESIVPERTPSCQLHVSTPGVSRLISPRTGDTTTPSDGHNTARFTPVRGTAQEVTHTASRRTGPRRWLRAVRWLIAAGLHSKATATTLRIAEDLAKRMDYSTGHVRYCIDEMVARLGISKASIKRHIGYLRELGALAWVQHGTRTNVRAAMGLKGYAATATVYAAAIPPSYDHAMGHRIIGTGYTARIIIDQRGPVIPTQPRNPVDNPPVDNSSSDALEPPSLTCVEEEGKLKVVEGVTTTAERSPKTSAAPTKTAKSSSGKKRATILGAIVTAAGMHLGDKLAQAIRRRVFWTRNATHEQLRWVCADMGEQQWSEDQAVRFVVEAGHTHKAGFAWNPDRPHRLIAAELRAHQERQEQEQQDHEARTQAVAWGDSTAARDLASLAALFGPAAPEPEPERTDEDRERARLYGWNDWQEVAAHLAEDQDDAIDLYGEDICKFAIGKQALLERRGAWV
jgi:hypothetical protein